MLLLLQKYQPVLTDKQQELTAIAFKLFNLRGDGKLTPDEFRQLLSALDVYLSSDSDLRDYINLIDWGHDGLDPRGCEAHDALPTVSAHAAGDDTRSHAA